MVVPEQSTEVLPAQIDFSRSTSVLDLNPDLEKPPNPRIMRGLELG
jgi:hypothetical protein